MPDAPPEPEEQYRADLQQTPLPEILFSIQRHRITGVIKAERGDRTTRVWVRNGAVEHAASNDREESLPIFLRRNGLLDQERFSQLLSKARNGRPVHEVLLEDGALSPAELFRASEQHVEWLVERLFSWEEGSVCFKIGDFQAREQVCVHLPLSRVILQGIQRAPAAKKLVGRLGRKETLLVPTYNTEQLVEVSLDGDAYQLLRMVNGKRSLFELCTRGPLPAPEAARLLYAFHVLHLIRRSDPTRNTIKLRYRDGED